MLENWLAITRAKRTICVEDSVMNDLLIEVRAAEGGDDAKALVSTQVAIYLKLATRRSL